MEISQLRSGWNSHKKQSVPEGCWIFRCPFRTRKLFSALPATMWLANFRRRSATIFSETGRDCLRAIREKTNPRPIPANANQTEKFQCDSTAGMCRVQAGDWPRQGNGFPRHFPCGRRFVRPRGRRQRRCPSRCSCHFSIISFLFSSASFSALDNSRSLSPCDSRNSTTSSTLKTASPLPCRTWT